MGNYNKNKGYGRNGGNKGSGRRNSGPSEMFKTTCDKCHQECEVPFKPTGNKPVYCSDCFQANKGSSGRPERRDRGNRSFGERKMYQAICETCGDACEIPFEPRGDKPVYCSDCFAKANPRKSGGGGSNNDSQFKELNEKLDKIFKLLESVNLKEVKPAKKTKKVVAKKVVNKKITKKSSVKKSSAKKKK